MALDAAEIVIRRGEQRDIPAVAALLHETWHHTYDPLMGAEAVERMSRAWHRPEALARQLTARGARFLVAECDGAIVGHAYARAGRQNAVFLARLYIDPAHQRRGIGTELLVHLLPGFPGARILELSVVKQNRAAVDFYRRCGFVIRGESTEDGVALLLIRRDIEAIPGV